MHSLCTSQTRAISCSYCNLVQFPASSGNCRRCHIPLSNRSYAATIGIGIRTLRVQHGFSQAELDAKIPSTRSYISTIERGASLPTVTNIERIAAVYDIADIFIALRAINLASEHVHLTRLQMVAA